MELFRNGYVVAKISTEPFAYNAWPLYDLENDGIAELLSKEADNNWFIKYDMEHIAPDLHFAQRYFNYCKSIGLQVKILLFESLDDTIIVDDKIEICEVLGFDCIGSVNYSYLQTEYESFKLDLQKKNIVANQYGLFDRLEDVLAYIELRQIDIASGINLEDFWKENPVRISVVNGL